MDCPSCGSFVSQLDRQCIDCGTFLDAAEQESSGAEVSPTKPLPNISQPHWQEAIEGLYLHRKALVLGIQGGILLCVVGLASMVFAPNLMVLVLILAGLVGLGVNAMSYSGLWAFAHPALPIVSQRIRSGIVVHLVVFGISLATQVSQHLSTSPRGMAMTDRSSIAWSMLLVVASIAGLLLILSGFSSLTRELEARDIESHVTIAGVLGVVLVAAAFVLPFWVPRDALMLVPVILLVLGSASVHRYYVVVNSLLELMRQFDEKANSP